MKFVIIKDFEIPSRCDECSLRHMGASWCNAAGKSTSHTSAGAPIDQTMRPKWCPLEEVEIE